MPHRRGPWSPGEDSYLVQLVSSQGAHNWVRISQLIGSRSPKQCRERFHQNLKPSLNHDPISPEEGLLIERLVGEIGKRWAEIARRLNGRSDNAVKNWWNGGMNRRRRLVVRRGETSTPDDFDERRASLSFARPAISASTTRPLQMTTISAPVRRDYGASLPSPASDVSAAPSLVSDNGSCVSVSPRSPMVSLPPIGSFGGEGRRLSLPAPQLGRGTYTPNRESSRSRMAVHEPKVWPTARLSPPPPLIPYSRSGHLNRPRDYHYLRHTSVVTSPQPPPPPLNGQRPLPNFMTISAPVYPPPRSPLSQSASERPPKDARMSVSTLLR